MRFDDPAMRFLILHPTTGDRAFGSTQGEADAAARWLRREAVEQGCSPRTRCMIVHLATDEEEH
jgi:hypothetical protein